MNCVASTALCGWALVSLRRRAAAHERDCEAEPIATSCTLSVRRRHELLSLHSTVGLGRARHCTQGSSRADDSRRRQRERDTQCGIVRPACNASLMSARSAQHHAVATTEPNAAAASALEADDRDSRFRSANRSSAATGKHWKCGLAAAAEDGRAASKRSRNNCALTEHGHFESLTGKQLKSRAAEHNGRAKREGSSSRPHNASTATVKPNQAHRSMTSRDSAMMKHEPGATQR